MNVGFMGLQFAFGLQQANLASIWGFLGQGASEYGWLGIGGALSGLIFQPLIGALSDRCRSRWGKRTPFIAGGAVLCAFALLGLPLSTSVGMAFVMSVLIDIGANITMEPYRAYMCDRLSDEKRSFGLLCQGAFTGLAQSAAYYLPVVVLWCGIDGTRVEANHIPTLIRITFDCGAGVLISTILMSIWMVPESTVVKNNGWLHEPKTSNIAEAVTDALVDVRVVLKTMRPFVCMLFVQWYAMCCVWNFSVACISKNFFRTWEASTDFYREALLLNGTLGALYNCVACLASLLVLQATRHFRGIAVHACCLVIGGVGVAELAVAKTRPALFASAIGIGIGWASMMGIPCSHFAQSIPKNKAGLYMGIYNAMVCLPLLLFAVTIKPVFVVFLTSDPQKAIVFASAGMGCAASVILCFMRASDADDVIY